MPSWLNVGVKGSASWPKEETTLKFGGHQLVLKPAKPDKEMSVHIALVGISDIEALTLINRFLSVLSWCSDQAMENLYGWSGNPVPVAVPRASRQIGSGVGGPFGYPFLRDLEPDKTVRLALALFREGRTVNSTPFEFLSYFKILNIFWKDKWTTANGQRQNPIVEGIRATLPSLKDEMVLRRLKKLRDIEPDVPKYLYGSGRCAIAHANLDPIVDPDDVSDLRRLSEDIHIIKGIAEHLMETELKISRSILH
jgi:Methylamine utilization protein MauJ